MEEYGVKLKVTADTEEARREMDELLARKGERVAEATGAGGAGKPGASADVESGRRAGRAAGQEFERQVEKGAAGKAIAKALAGFALHQGLGTAFELARNPGGDNTNLDRARATVTGALQFGTTGAMLGGPWGAAIGAALGAGVGLAGQMGRERADQRETKIGMWKSAWQNSEAALAGLGQIAQARLVDWQGSREGRIEWLTENRRDLQNRQAESARKLAAFGGDKSSTEYAYLQGEYQRLGAAYNRAAIAEAQERMKPLSDLYGSGEFSDSLSKRGLMVGPTVDVRTANERIVEQQAQMVNLLQRIVDLSNAGAAANGVRLGEALREIYDATSLR